MGGGDEGGEGREHRLVDADGVCHSDIGVLVAGHCPTYVQHVMPVVDTIDLKWW